MRKALGISAVSALLLMACNSNGAKQASDVDSTNVAVEDAKPMVELTDNRFQELIAAIDRSTEDYEKWLTNEYCKAWNDALEIPSGGLGEIGNDEFLYYLVCNVDPCSSHTGKMLSTDIKGDTAYVKFNIIHTDHPEENNKIHNFKLVLKDEEWVIADYDNTIQTMLNYRKEEYNYLKSPEYRNAAEEILNDPEAEEFWKDAVREELEEVDEFLKKNPR